MVDVKLSPEQFADKIEWEGGIEAALEYGIRADRIDISTKTGHELATAGRPAVMVELLAAIDRVEEILDGI